MQNILTLETKKYAIKINNFEGPLDLLCHLIDKNKMNINDINISDITDQYIDYINNMEKLNLDITSEFIVMASTLIYIKSKSLLPTVVEDEKELSEEELIKRIVEYKKYKEITKKLKENYEVFSKRIFKGQQDIKLPKQQLKIEYSDILIPDYYIKVIERYNNKMNKNAKTLEQIAITETITVASKVRQIFKVLSKKHKFIFNKLFSITKHNKIEVVTAFSGLLELTTKKKVLTIQEKLFGDIVVQKNDIIE